MVGEASGRMQKADCRDEIALPAAMLAWLKYRKQRTRNTRKRFLVFFCSLFVKARVVYRLPSLFPRGWIFCTGNRQEFNQGKKVIIIPITVTNSFSNFDFIVESFKLAGTYLMFCMIDKSRQSFFFNFRKMN